MGTIGGYLKLKIQAEIKGLIFNPKKPEGIIFTQQDNNGLQIILREKISANLLDRRMSIDVTFYHLFKKQQILILENIARKLFQSDFYKLKVPHVVRGSEKISASGQINSGYSVPFHLYPEDLQIEVVRCHELGLSYIARFLGILKWCQDLYSLSSMVQFSHISWCDGAHFYAFPDQRGDQTVESPRGVRWTDLDAEQVAKLWVREDTREPVGHQIIAEAMSLQWDSPAASALLSVTALEAGVKEYCSAKFPENAWLLENAPSPPVVKILKKYVPLVEQNSTAINREEWKKIFDPIVNQIGKFIEKRNGLAHLGKVNFSCEELGNHLQNVRDILYALDVLRGEMWAKQSVSYKIRRMLNWPEPNFKRFYVTMMKQE